MRVRAFVSAVALAAVAAALPVAAQQTAPTKAAVPATAAEVTGFRSARFGMSEAEVRAAIVKDFKLKSEEIKGQQNPVEKTRVLTTFVPELIANGGRAAVAYLLGFKSQKLFAVNVTWSAETDPGISAETLVANANILSSHFRSAGYQPDSIVQNIVLPDGRLVVFRGADEAKRSVQVSLLGAIAEQDGQKLFTPAALQLTYIEDAQHPDIFKLQPGQF